MTASVGSSKCFGTDCCGPIIRGNFLLAEVVELDLNRLALRLIGRNTVGQIPELSIAIGMRTALERLAVGLQATPCPLQSLARPALSRLSFSEFSSADAKSLHLFLVPLECASLSGAGNKSIPA